ncbi:MAG: cache domain-containing protein [Dehalococcoidia bacterium]|nr:cache domain-containing protein [Dehalococcoidia bacterium]
MKRPVMVLAICLALSAAAGCAQTAESNKMDTQIGASALAALADSIVGSYVNSMEILAATQEVQSGDWEAIRPLLAKAADPENALVWYVLPDGTYFTVDEGEQSASLSDRPYFPGLLAGNTVIGYPVVSKATGRKSAVVAVPIVREGEVAGGLGASIFLDELSNTLSQALGLPGDMVFYAVSPEGEVVLHSDTEMIMADDPALSDNVRWQTSSLTGWRFALGMK